MPRSTRADAPVPLYEFRPSPRTQILSVAPSVAGDLDATRKPLTPALSPEHRGEGAGSPWHLQPSSPELETRNPEPL